MNNFFALQISQPMLPLVTLMPQEREQMLAAIERGRITSTSFAGNLEQLKEAPL
jgi:hypothetical protein